MHNEYKVKMIRYMLEDVLYNLTKMRETTEDGFRRIEAGIG